VARPPGALIDGSVTSTEGGEGGGAAAAAGAGAGAGRSFDMGSVALPELDSDADLDIPLADMRPRWVRHAVSPRPHCNTPFLLFFYPIRP
jgi:hypothetical protein